MKKKKVDEVYYVRMIAIRGRYLLDFGFVPSEKEEFEVSSLVSVEGDEKQRLDIFREMGSAFYRVFEKEKNLK